MREIKVLLKDDTPELVEIDGEKVPIEAFVLLTSVPQRDSGHFLAFGNSDTIGKMFYSFWRWSVSESPELAYVQECVSKDICSDADKARGTVYFESKMTN